MAKKKMALRKKVIKKVMVSPQEVDLPPQDIEDIQLLHTETSLILKMSKPNVFREELLKLKKDFVVKVEKMSNACGVTGSVRVYFTFTEK